MAKRERRERDPSTARAGSMWSHAEYIRVLQAWRFAVQTQSAQEASGSASTPAIVPEDVARRTLARFEELTKRDEGHSTCRSVDAITRKMETFMRVYRVIVAYNEQQQVERQRGQRQKLTTQLNFWLALSLSKQQRVFAAYHAPSSFISVDAEMYTLLSAIDRARSHATAHKKSHATAHKKSPRVLLKTSSAWTKGEEWVLVTAWRQAVEAASDRDSAQDHTLAHIYARFCALARPGMPQRTKGSVKAKVANLAGLYKLVKDFNARAERRGRRPTGPHSGNGDEDDDSDWFSASSDAKAQHLIESNVSRVTRIADFDRDTFQALELIMARVSGDATRSDVHHVIIELSSDTEDNDNDDGDDGESDWELLSTASARDEHSTPAPPRATAATASSSGHAFAWPSVVDASAWSTEHDAAPASAERTPRAATLSVARHSRQSSPAAPAARTPCVEVASSRPSPRRDPATPDSDSTSTERARKRARVALKQETRAPEPDAAVTTTTATSKIEERFLTILAKLKRERRADKAKRRAERHEREALTALIAEERKLRRRDKKERQRERREWELERDKLKLKLKSMREKYRRARRALMAS